MSEYVTFEILPGDEAGHLQIITNQTLTQFGEEVYDSPEAGDEGSPIAQMLFNGIDGLRALTLRATILIIRHDPDIPAEVIADEVRDALRDFFL